MSLISTSLTATDFNNMIRFKASLLYSLCPLCTSLIAAEPEQRDVIKLQLGKRTSLDVVYIPAGKFMMGSTAEEKAG